VAILLLRRFPAVMIQDSSMVLLPTPLATTWPDSDDGGSRTYEREDDPHERPNEPHQSPPHESLHSGCRNKGQAHCSNKHAMCRLLTLPARHLHDLHGREREPREHEVLLARAAVPTSTSRVRTSTEQTALFPISSVPLEDD
jgi:hypothetical protein